MLYVCNNLLCWDSAQCSSALLGLGARVGPCKCGYRLVLNHTIKCPSFSHHLLQLVLTL